MCQIGLQDPLDCSRRVFRLHAQKKPAAERAIGPKTTADQDVIALDWISVIVLLNLAGQQADLRDEMLCTGMMTAGQVDVDRRIERNARFAPAGDLLGVPLGV